MIIAPAPHPDRPEREKHSPPMPLKEANFETRRTELASKVCNCLRSVSPAVQPLTPISRPPTDHEPHPTITYSYLVGFSPSERKVSLHLDRDPQWGISASVSIDYGPLSESFIIRDDFDALPLLDYVRAAVK